MYAVTLADLAAGSPANTVEVFSCDNYLWALLEGNLFTILFVLAVLKIFAKVTPWSEDDQIIESLIGFFGSFRRAPNAPQETEVVSQ